MKTIFLQAILIFLYVLIIYDSEIKWCTIIWKEKVSYLKEVIIKCHNTICYDALTILIVIFCLIHITLVIYNNEINIIKF